MIVDKRIWRSLDFDLKLISLVTRAFLKTDTEMFEGRREPPERDTAWGVGGSSVWGYSKNENKKKKIKKK